MLHFSEDRMDDFRHDAMEELQREAEYDAHEAHYGYPDPECWLCQRDAEEAAEEALN